MLSILRNTVYKRARPVIAHPSWCIRGYALSRFPERGPGSGRHRTSPTNGRVAANTGKQETDSFAHETTPSAEESPLWQAGRRAPEGNPEEGLRHILMNNDLLVVTRQIEMMNIFLGFEQANRYVISNLNGEPLGYIAEEPRGILSTFSRQIFRTHRPFRALVLDLNGSPVLWIRRPFAWINSRMFVQRLKDLQEYSPEGEPVLDTFAEVQQEWHLWRRRYDLFLREKSRRILSLASERQPEPEPDSFTQFARVDEGLLAWHFTLYGAQQQELASISRQFRGFGRELFTDTGQYFVRFGPTPQDGTGEEQPVLLGRPHRPLELEERALSLAMAVNVDFDYFSRHSEGHGSGFVWFGGNGSWE